MNLQITVRAIATLILATGCYAQSEVDQLKARVAALEQQLARMEEKLESIQGATTAAPATKAPPTGQAAPVISATTKTISVPPGADRATVQQNETSVARVDNVPLETPTSKASFVFPGLRRSCSSEATSKRISCMT